MLQSYFKLIQKKNSVAVMLSLVKALLNVVVEHDQEQLKIWILSKIISWVSKSIFQTKV